jgi:hypothetical protein
VNLTVSPAFTVADVGVAAIEKSGPGTTVIVEVTELLGRFDTSPGYLAVIA